jgi:hypothetical protein
MTSTAVHFDTSVEAMTKPKGKLIGQPVGRGARSQVSNSFAIFFDSVRIDPPLISKKYNLIIFQQEPRNKRSRMSGPTTLMGLRSRPSPAGKRRPGETQDSPTIGRPRNNGKVNIIKLICALVSNLYLHWHTYFYIQF